MPPPSTNASGGSATECNVRVAVRVRPLGAASAKERGVPAWRVDAAGGAISCVAPQGGNKATNPKEWRFEKVFGPDMSTGDLYSEYAQTLAADAVGGYNACIFAYGQTSSGKTHTMRGTEEEPGVGPRAIADVIGAAAADDEREYLFRCSYVEVYKARTRQTCPIASRLPPKPKRNRES